MAFILTFVLLLGSSALTFAVRTRAAFLAQAALFVWAGAYLTYYVASEDDYRRNGISRWEAYDAKALTVAAIAGCFAVAAGALVAERRSFLRRGVWVLAVVGAALFLAAFIANTAN